MKKRCIDWSLSPSEEIIFRTSKSKLFFLINFVLTLSVSYLISWSQGSTIGLILDTKESLIKAILDIVVLVVPWYIFFTRHLNLIARGGACATITNERIVWQDEAVFLTYSFECKISEIKGVVSKQPFFGKIFNYSNIYIVTDNEMLVLYGIKDYVNCLKIIKDMIKENNPTPKIDKIEKFI